MNSKLNIKVEQDKNNEEKYLIKDLNNIILGRFKVYEMNNETRRCSIKLYCYRLQNYIVIRDAIKYILNAVFKNKCIFKVNIFVKEGIDISAFLDLGFTLEGILSQNEYDKGEFIDELLLGITKSKYENIQKYLNVYLRGKDIYIRNLTPADAENLLEYYKRNKEHLQPFEPIRDETFFTLEIQNKLLIESYKHFMNGSNIDMGIFKDEYLIGKIKISSIIQGSFKSGFIGYSMDKDYCGNGYMTEALKLVLKYSFDECDLHRIEASALVDNEKSRNVLRRCGFKLIGINEKYLFINGKWQDHATYFMLKEYFCK